MLCLFFFLIVPSDFLSYFYFFIIPSIISNKMNVFNKYLQNWIEDASKESLEMDIIPEFHSETSSLRLPYIWLRCYLMWKHHKGLLNLRAFSYYIGSKYQNKQRTGTYAHIPLLNLFILSSLLGKVEFVYKVLWDGSEGCIFFF